MLSYTVYTEAGGTYKTTTAVNLARAHTDQGLNVLCIDLDHQKGNLSHVLEVADDQSNPEADHLPRHLVDRGRGSFRDLIQTTDEGFDVLPAHDKLEDLTEDVRTYQEMVTSMDGITDEEFDRHTLLFETLRDADIHQDYDVLIIDPNARAELSLYNALYATRNVVAPVKYGGKGSLSIDGLEELGEGFGQQEGINIGVKAIVPNKVRDTNAQQLHRQEVEDRGFDIPVTIGDRESMMEAMWDAHGSAFKVIEEGWYKGAPGDRPERDREQDTLDQIRQLADFLAGSSDVDYQPVAEQEGEVVA